MRITHRAPITFFSHHLVTSLFSGLRGGVPGGSIVTSFPASSPAPSSTASASSSGPFTGLLAAPFAGAGVFYSSQRIKPACNLFRERSAAFVDGIEPGGQIGEGKFQRRYAGNKGGSFILA
jgi:hypothetical protein